MSSPALMRNIGAFLMPEGENADHEIADATYLTGTIVDRQALGNPQSCVVCVGVHFASASGASGGLNTLAIELLGDSDAAMGSATSLDTDSYVYTWVADGDNKGFHTMAVDLSGATAERYIRARCKLTEAGTITVTEQCLTVGVLFGGLDVTPDPSFAAAGNEVTTEPS